MSKNFTIPTYLTFIRLFSPILILLSVLTFNSQIYEFVILIIFILASITDYLDGFLARKYNLTSELGRILDPIADKVLTLSTLVILIYINSAPIVPTIIILFREIFISGIREALGSLKLASLKVSFLSKIKTTIQFIAISILCGNKSLESFTGYETYLIGEYLIWIASFITIYTGISYCYKVVSEIKKVKL